ncbi:MAG: pyruvate kinase [Ruminococcaceae bacterium]|nr:pyruvate kinase [Oscillospiraceae bacterium]
MRKTKIICTVGPACSNEETLTNMCLAGMNVARLNFSHGTHKQHKEMIDLVKKVREKLSLPIAIMLDTRGPEYRIKTFENGKVTLSDGDEFTFTTEEIIGNSKKVSVNYKGLIDDLEIGDTILVNNGLVSFKVKELSNTEALCTVVSGGELSNQKSMSFPNKVLKQTFLSEQDKSDILFGIENDIDYIAASFVSCEQDIIDIKSFIDENRGSEIGIVAKIENRFGVDNIYDICKHCEGVMIARGDLGVEIPFKELPAVQKKLITTCRMLGKRIITATEMLETMIYNPRPTRAEISDVANAVYDGTSAVMLSGETAAGKFPVQTVKIMSDICEETENNIHYNKRFHRDDFKIENNMDAISHAACSMAIDVDARAIAVCSLSGKTARLVSRFRPVVDIIGLTTNKKAWRKLALSWGVIPVMYEEYPSSEVMFYNASRKTQKILQLEDGDNIIIVGGTTSGRSGETNTIRLEKISIKK